MIRTNRTPLLVGLLFSFALALPVRAQISAPFEITASSPVLSADLSTPVAGDNPFGVDFGFEPEPGGLVQIIDVGGNGVPDLIQPDGSPGGDDTIYEVTAIGVGIAPNVLRSGLFAASFYPPPSQGTVLYARIFDGPSTATASHWSQTGTFTVDGRTIMDINRLGITAVMQPLGVNPETADSDFDGVSNADELIANTDPNDADAHLKAAMAGHGVAVRAEAGRVYRLHRTTSALTAPVKSWDLVAETGQLDQAREMVLNDPNPPVENQVFYRIEVELP